MSVNVVFINIDWKRGRHGKNVKRNMELLANTIRNVVEKMKPTMICTCEVGLATIPLTQEQMEQVAEESMKAWKEAAGDQVLQLRSMFQVGAPYMTIYIKGPIECSCHRILKEVYTAGGEPRTAQTFLCSGPDGVTVDVINVHAPTGKKRLTDTQRKKLLENLLQSTSNSMSGQAIGGARFLIGGDMNTTPQSLSLLLQWCCDQAWLHTPVGIHKAVCGYTGDLCFLRGFKADTLTTRAGNHDRQHVPYGICWSQSEQ